MPCIFCRIAADEASSRTVYRNADVMAFLDANPLAPGHTLVIPTEHHERLQDCTAGLASELFGVVHHLVEPIQSAVDADGCTVAVNNGPAAGQDVPHVHCHLVPRFDDDGGGPIHVAMGPEPHLDDDELDAIAERIAAAS